MTTRNHTQKIDLDKPFNQALAENFSGKPQLRGGQIFPLFNPSLSAEVPKMAAT